MSRYIEFAKAGIGILMEALLLLDREVGGTESACETQRGMDKLYGGTYDG